MDVTGVELLLLVIIVDDGGCEMPDVELTGGGRR